MSVINLNKARKAKARAEAETKAAQNRIAFGRTKAEKTKSRAEAEKAARDLAGHQRDED